MFVATAKATQTEQADIPPPHVVATLSTRAVKPDKLVNDEL
jgi:hypothetical protein